jgi:hypothetical protein
MNPPEIRVIAFALAHICVRFFAVRMYGRRSHSTSASDWSIVPCRIS